jgi:hypothetical protein
MPTVASIMAELKKKGKESTRKIYARHGMATENMYGVSVADLRSSRKPSKDNRRSLANFTRQETWTLCTSLGWSLTALR